MLFKYNLFGFDKDGYNRQGFDKMGYDRDGFDAQGYDRSGYNKQGFHKLTGLDRDGYDADGFDTAGYDRAGYDHDGFSREGFNQDGYDREGYDRIGFDRSGLDRDGYDADGYDRLGYDRGGYDKNGFDRTGYNCSGFDSGGFDRAGFNAYGYDKNGLDKTGYDVNGFDRFGFDKDGFDQFGFNKAGYDRSGFDVDGFDRNGRDAAGYDKAGYDSDGFDRNGYDCDGYDLCGYNSDGWDREGYNAGGFDSNGYDRHGFNAEGKTDAGFDRSEFDAEGFHILTGYNPFGFDREGFNINGIDVTGYDRDGFHAETGLNREGYDRDGYDAQGYDRSGYNRAGRNKNGRTPKEEERAKLMTVVWVGHDGSREIAKQSDKPAIWRQTDADGFASDGYDISGRDRGGFDRAGFNKQGLHNKTGTRYNDLGYDVAGFDQDGFDRSGYNANGLDRYGYDYNGFDAAGFDRSGFDRNGYDVNGIDRHGFMRDHICAKTGTPFGPDGYDYQGYDCNGYNREQIHREGYHISASYQEKEDTHERAHFEHVEKIAAQKLHTLQAEAKQHEWTGPLNAYECDDEDFDPYEYGKDMSVYRQAEAALKSGSQIWKSICSQPFFARIDWAGKKGVYIGKYAVPEEVVDWADRICSLYYDYQMYIGNQDYGLELVRDFDISSGVYYGFTDKYAAHSAAQENGQQNMGIITDERLLAVINTYKAEKRVHDIVATIQKNQYNIIADEPSANIIVNGCAGSGKTMIMFHRLRYLLYNYPEINPENTFLISPSGILNGESDQLSIALQLQKVNRLSADQFYGYIINAYEKKQKQRVTKFDPLTLVSNRQLSDNILRKIYSAESVNDYSETIFRLFSSKVQTDMQAFISSECAFLAEKLEALGIHAEGGVDGLTAAVDRFKETLSRSTKDIKVDREDEEEPEKEAEPKGQMNAEDPEEHAEENAAEKPEETAEDDTEKESEEKAKEGTEKKAGPEKKPVRQVRRKLYEEVYLSAVSELQSLSRENGLAMLRSEKTTPDYLPVVHDLLAHKRFCGTTKKVKRSEKIFEDPTKAISNVKRLYDDWNHGIFGIELYHDPFEFFDVFNSVCAQIEALKKYAESADRVYGDYAVKRICTQLKDQFGLASDMTFEWELFYQCIGKYLLFGALSGEKSMIFIDEYQDYSQAELDYLLKIFPTGVFNLFGDPNQCISVKGLSSENALTFPAKRYQLNENYRNALEITNLVNQEFAMHMLPIGIKGSVKSDARIRADAKDLANGDRVAIVYKENSELERNGILESSELFHFITHGNTDISRKCINVMPIYYAKGLEFEKVYVLTKGMTNNERYVAMPRALNELIFI